MLACWFSVARASKHYSTFWHVIIIIVIIIIIIIIYSLTARVVGAQRLISQPVSSIFPCPPLPTVIWWTPGLSIPLCCLFLCLPCLLAPFTVPCKMVLTRRDERKTWPHHCSLRLFTICQEVFLWSDCLLDLGTDVQVGDSLCMRCVVSCGSTSFLWLVFFFEGPWWGFCEGQ